MSEEKLSSEQVPQKFSEWLLSMGCPPEDVPPTDKITEMCRGQYYMVWRSLMEHVEPKDRILIKRLQVFNDDVVKCQKKNVFNKLDVNMPKELSLWRQHSELKEQVTEVEGKLSEERDTLNQLVNKVSSKLAQRNLSKKRLLDAQRRSWFLQQVSTDLQERKANLQETKVIADSLCCVDDSHDVMSKLEKCMSSLSRVATSRAGVSLLSVANPVASSSIASTYNSDNDAEEHVSSLVKCRADLVYKQLLERRVGLCTAVAARADTTTKDKDGNTPQSVLAHTAGLHCTLALEALKNRTHIKQTRKRLAATLNELNNQLTGEACELLVVRSERAHGAARAQALRALLAEVSARAHVFACPGGGDAVPAGAVHNVDKSILSKRDELKRLIISAAAVERKTQNARDSLAAVFSRFHDNGRIEGASQMSIVSPHESISNLRQFYEERHDRRAKNLELSMDLDVSGSGSSYELTDNGSAKFLDELRIYLKKFSLEKNRKFVLESGDKIWIFETLQASLDQLYAKWHDDDVTTLIVCPSVSLAHNLSRLAQELTAKTELESLVRFLEDGGKKHELSLDISSITQDEERTLDKIKKRLNENIINLQKTEKTINIGIENLNIWTENSLKQYISDNRTVDGRSYRDYERTFLECLRM